jgi:hypothetical protein
VPGLRGQVERCLGVENNGNSWRLLALSVRAQRCGTRRRILVEQALSDMTFGDLARGTAQMIQRHFPSYFCTLAISMGLAYVGSAGALLVCSDWFLQGTDAYEQLLFIVAVEFFIALLFQPGFIRIALRAAHRMGGEGSELFMAFDRVPAYLVASLLFAVIVALGTVCLVVPGVWAAGRLSLYGFAIVEERKGPLEALRRSYDLTKGRLPLIVPLQLLVVGCVAATTVWSLGFTVMLPVYILPWFLWGAIMYAQITEKERADAQAALNDIDFGAG